MQGPEAAISEALVLQEHVDPVSETGYFHLPQFDR